MTMTRAINMLIYFAAEVECVERWAVLGLPYSTIHELNSNLR